VGCFDVVELLQEGKTNLKRSVKPGMDLVNIKLALDDIYLMLTSVNEYVDKVLVRKREVLVSIIERIKHVCFQVGQN